MTVIRCPECDARVEVKPDDPSPHCDYCGTPLSVPRGGDAVAELVGRVFAGMDGDGAPDVLRNAASSDGIVRVSGPRYVVDGKGYSDVDDLPPKAREALERARKVLDGAMPGQAVTVSGPTTVSTTSSVSTSTSVSTETAPAPSVKLSERLREKRDPPRPRHEPGGPAPAGAMAAAEVPGERTPPGRGVVVLVAIIAAMALLGLVVWVALGS